MGRRWALLAAILSGSLAWRAWDAWTTEAAFTMKGPERLESARLVLRKPKAGDAQAIFERYSGDSVVTKYMSWPVHRSVEDTRAFLAWSDADWEEWPAGSYLIFAKEGGALLGGTGLSFQSPEMAVTGYVLAQDAWGRGYATEALQAMVELAETLGVEILEASCHAEHRASARVLEKCGFRCDGLEREGGEFPNLDAATRHDVLRYSRGLGAQDGHS
jgi:[ribosomal protein S5]-alanine N-acetyltransferase